jgi:c-di-GMP phosphodiesterase
MDIFFARQPIFDRTGDVAGYELLYRASAEHDRAVGEASSMSSRVLVDALLAAGLEDVTGGSPAFINVSRDLLIGGATEVLDPARIVLEVLEDTPADEEVVAACARLSATGFRIALDDYVSDDARWPLLRHAGLVKVDLPRQPPERLGELVRELHAHGTRLVAEKIEDGALWNRCRDLGFDYFQGYFFRRPQIVSRRDLAADQLRILELYNLLQDPNVSEAAVEDAFRANVALSYKLLAMANTAAVGTAGIESIAHALRLLGRGTLARWVALLLAAAAGRRTGTRVELLRETLLRARLCERIAETGTLRRDAGPLFLIGLLSHLGALLGTPLTEIVARLRIAPTVRDAVLQRTGPLAPPLLCVEAYELGHWTEAEAHAARVGVPPHRLPALYREAIDWLGRFAHLLQPSAS